MENQHRKIAGYRELSQSEIDLMNEIKALGPAIQAVVLKVQEHLLDQRTTAARTMQGETFQEEIDRLEAATPERFAALAKTDLQTGLMYLTRAIAQPTFF